MRNLYRHFLGIYKEKNKYLNVNRGLGTTAVPGRLVHFQKKGRSFTFLKINLLKSQFKLFILIEAMKVL